MIEDTVGIIVAVAVVYFVGSWLFKGSPTNPSNAASSGGPPVLGQGILRGVNESMVEAVSSAFPDVARERILYDLSRTRNVQATVEKILTTGGLPAPPPGLFPPSPPPPSSASSSSPSSSSTNPSGSNATSSRRPQTLIDRFDLTSRVAKGKDVDRAFSSDPITGAAPTTTKFAAAGNASKWEATAEAREASLKRRKEEMVLEARRKLLEKKAARAAAETLAGTSSS